MRSANVSLAEVLRRAMDARERQLAVALPGTVVSYDASTLTATIRPGVNRLVPSIAEDDDEVEELPAIPAVPVCWPVGRGFKFVATLDVGDPVLLVCCDRDISGWLRSGAPADPDDARTHTWANAVAIPGLVHQSYTNAPSDAAALASKVDKLIKVICNTTVPASGGGLALQTSMRTAFPGFASVIPTVPAPEPIGITSVASTVLKLEE